MLAKHRLTMCKGMLVSGTDNVILLRLSGRAQCKNGPECYHVVSSELQRV